MRTVCESHIDNRQSSENKQSNRMQSSCIETIQSTTLYDTSAVSDCNSIIDNTCSAPLSHQHGFHHQHAHQSPITYSHLIRSSNIEQDTRHHNQIYPTNSIQNNSSTPIYPIHASSDASLSSSTIQYADTTLTYSQPLQSPTVNQSNQQESLVSVVQTPAYVYTSCDPAVYSQLASTSSTSTSSGMYVTTDNQLINEEMLQQSLIKSSVDMSACECSGNDGEPIPMHMKPTDENQLNSHTNMHMNLVYYPEGIVAPAADGEQYQMYENCGFNQSDLQHHQEVATSNHQYSIAHLQLHQTPNCVDFASIYSPKSVVIPSNTDNICISFDNGSTNFYSADNEWNGQKETGLEAHTVRYLPVVGPSIPSDIGTPIYIRHSTDACYVAPRYQSNLRVLVSSPPPSCADVDCDASYQKSPRHYTAFPMLPPIRYGTGLYCNFFNAYEKRLNAFSVIRKTPMHESVGAEFQDTTQIESVLESDTVPRINVGADYQAQIPDCTTQPTARYHQIKDHQADLMWNPFLFGQASPCEIAKYIEFAARAISPGGGRGEEYALCLLCSCGGHIRNAMLRLLQPCPILSHPHPLQNLSTMDSDRWSPVEVQCFNNGIHMYRKNFSLIAHEVSTKCVSQCVQFYYLWKFICRKEYEHCKHVSRAHTIQPCIEPFSGAAAVALAAPTPPNMQHLSALQLNTSLTPCHDASTTNIPPNMLENTSSNPAQDENSISCGAQPMYISKNGLASQYEDWQHIIAAGHEAETMSRGFGLNCHQSQLRPQAVKTVNGEYEFPCKVCGKIFQKVKSRNAHMKSHRIIDSVGKRRSFTKGSRGRGAAAIKTAAAALLTRRIDQPSTVSLESVAVCNMSEQNFMLPQ